MRVPFHRPALGPSEAAAIQAVLDRGWLTTGEECRAFEEELAATLGAAAAVAVSSGTAALELAMAAFDIGPGDEVITSPLAFVASAETITARGARPVFADVNPTSGNLDPEAARAALRPATRAILGLPLGGDPEGLDRLAALCREQDLIFGIDAAHGLETQTALGPLARQADFVALSFYASKNLTTGEGGAVLLRDATRRERMTRMRVHGMDRASRERDQAARPWDYDVLERGLKANLSDLAAALGRAQLARLDDFREARLLLVHRYLRELADVATLELPREPEAKTGRHAWHLFSPLLRGDNPAPRRDRLLETMVAAGIGVSVHFRPLHLMTAYRALGAGPGSFPKAEERWRRSFSLPLFPGLREDEQARVVAVLRRALEDEAS
jgi:dTDP-4-amino-4,6-dideoxygalactose transaminase